MPTVAELLKEHVALEIECFDRLYLNAYIPQLQIDKQLTYFLTQHLGNKIPSPALLGRLTQGFVQRVEAFIEEQGFSVVQFQKKDRKDTIANEIRRKDPRRDAVIFVGVAQEKQQAFKGKKSVGGKKGYIHFAYSRQSTFVKQYYFYRDDSDFGPCFIKIGTYAPFPIRICLNGHEWAKRQLEKKGIPYESLDNGFLSCPDAQRLQKICDSLGPGQIERFFRKWIRRLPFPLSAKDIKAGYRHQLTVWQAEFSSTQVMDRPVRGREFFEAVIRENLDMGRPDRVQLLAGFWFLDTGFWIMDAWCHCGSSIQQQGSSIEKVERVSEDCIVSAGSVERLSQPTVTDTGQKAPGMRFGDPRVMALFAALALFLHLPNGFRNRDLRAHVADLLDLSLDVYHAGKMTYDLRRLRLKGILARQPGTTRYDLTPYGVQAVQFLSRVHARLLRPGLGCLQPDGGVHVPHRLRQAMDKVNEEIDRMLERSFPKIAS